MLFLVLAVQACSGGSGDGPSGPGLANTPPQIVRTVPAETSVVSEAGQPLTFSIEATDPEGRPLTFEVLVDGTPVATSSSFSFAPDSAGTYQITLRVSDGVNQIVHQWSITVTPDVPNAPVASLSVSPDSGTAPLQVAISASGSDVDGSVVRVQVDADADGVYETEGAGPVTLSHVFDRAGTFRVKARVTDNDGLTGFIERLVRVRVNLPPRATLSVVPPEGPAPLSVRVQGTGTDPEGGAIIRYELDAEGDGTYEIVQAQPIDTTLVFEDYTRSYTVRLRVTDAGGATGTAEETVQPLPNVDTAASRITQSETDRLLANGRATRRITVRVVDTTGRPVPSVEVELSSSRNQTEVVDRITPERGLTDATGLFEADLTTTSSSTFLGDALINAEVAGQLLEQALTVQFISAVSASMSSISCPSGITYIIGSPREPRTARVTARVHDIQDRPLANIFVELVTRDLTIWRVNPPSGRTDSEGKFVAHVTSTEADNTFVDVHADGLRTSAICSLVFRP